MSIPPDSDSPQLPVAEEAPQCAACKALLGDSYYEANNAPVCENCAASLQQTQAPQGSRLGRLTKALLLGALAAAGGAAIQFSVLHFLDLNAALVTILIGFMVGTAVRSGSGGRGGWRYQLIAVVLTYLAIGAAYVPIAIAELKAAHEQQASGLPVPGENLNADKFKARKVTRATPAPAPAPAAEESEPISILAVVVAVIVGIFVLPVTVGISSPLNILIFGFGIYQAWKMNKATPIAITGPHWRSPQGPPLPA